MEKKKKCNEGEKKAMEETSEGATEEGFLSQDGQTCKRCGMYRKEQQSQFKSCIDWLSDTIYSRQPAT